MSLQLAEASSRVRRDRYRYWISGHLAPSYFGQQITSCFIRMVSALGTRKRR